MKLLILPLSVLLIFGISACSPKYYVPNTQNVPLLTHRGEVNLSVAGNSNQFELQGAVALTNHLGIVANGSYYYMKDDVNGNGGYGALGEAGAGYYLPVLSHFVFETYAMAGYGQMENHMPSTMTDYPNTSGKINASLFRFALQPNFGYKSKYFSAAISSRFVSLNYNEIKGDLVFDGQDQSVYLKNHRSLFIAEPAITLRGGLKNVKLQVQLSGSYNLTKSDFLQESELLSVGLNVNLF